LIELVQDYNQAMTAIVVTPNQCVEIMLDACWIEEKFL
jgi:hypothetical protein